MLLVSIFVVVFVALLLLRLWMHVDDAPMGRMSEAWLAEYRATHSL